MLERVMECVLVLPEGVRRAATIELALVRICGTVIGLPLLSTPETTVDCVAQMETNIDRSSGKNPPVVFCKARRILGGILTVGLFTGSSPFTTTVACTEPSERTAYC